MVGVNVLKYQLLNICAFYAFQVVLKLKSQQEALQVAINHRSKKNVLDFLTATFPSHVSINVILERLEVFKRISNRWFFSLGLEPGLSKNIWHKFWLNSQSKNK